MKLRNLFGLGRAAPAAPPRSEAVGDSMTLVDLNDPRLADLLRDGRTSSAGIVVTMEGAMRVATAWRCTHIIAGVCGNLPIDVYYRKDEKTRVPAVGHPLRKLLTEKPNGWQTPAEFRKMLTAHAVNEGNGYALKITSLGKVIALWPLNPWRMEVRQLDDMSLEYDYRTPKGRVVTFKQADILHLRGLTVDGIRGVGVLRYAREALGLSIQTEKAGARLFSQGVLAGGALRTDNKLSDEAYNRLKADIDENNAGAENAHKMMILEEGLDFATGMISADDAQFLETRKFERGDVAMFYGVPPHMTGDTEKATSWGSGIEQQGIGFNQYTALDWTTMWEHPIARDLFTDADRANGLFIKIDGRALQRGDTKARTEGYSKALGAGGSPAWMTVNEVRALEDMPPIAGGELLPRPTNVAPPAAPKPDDEDEDEDKPDGGRRAA